MSGLNPSDVLKAGRGSGAEDCVICNLKVKKDEPVVVVEITIGSTFIKALQKKLRKESHLACAELVHSVLGLRLVEANK